MINTKIKKAIAIASVAAISATSMASSFAATNIGTATVTGNAGLTTNISWDETFTAGSASGSVSGIVVKAKVLPALNMVVSTDELDLGTLTAGTASSQSLNLEVGTNAANGVVVTARSGNGGLQNTSNTGVYINNSTTDGIQENYTFASAKGTDDSDYSTFAFDSDSDLTALEVTDNTTEHKIYGTNKPEAATGTDDVTFTVSATSNAQTAAGDYEDNVTFTVTGNF